MSIAQLTCHFSPRSSPTSSSLAKPYLLPSRISRALCSGSRSLTLRFNLVHNASRLLVLGTSLATYSAFRLIKAAREAGKPVLMISQGPSRADDTEGVDKMDTRAGPVLRAFLDQYLE